MDDTYFQQNLEDDYKNYKKHHNALNFYLPHEFGGCGEPRQLELYGLFNRYLPEMDLACIKPRWTSKHEFNIDLPHNPQLDEIMNDDHEEELLEPESATVRPNSIQMKKLPSISTNIEKQQFSMKFEKTVMKEFES